MNKTQGIIILLSIALSACVCLAADLQRLSLEDIYQLALSDNESIKIAFEESKQADATKWKSVSTMLPSIVIDGGYKIYDKESGFPNPFTGETLLIQPKEDYDYGLYLNQNIWDGGRYIYSNKAATYYQALTDWSYILSAQQVLLSTTACYYQVLKAQRNLEISQHSLKLANEHLENARALFEAGMTIETTVLRAQMGVQNAKRELIQSKHDLKIAQEELRHASGVKGEFELVEPTEPNLPPGDIEQIIRSGLKDNPGIYIANYIMKMAQMDHKASITNLIPKITFSASYLKRKADFPSDESKWVEFRANVPIFLGGYNYAEMAEKRSVLRQKRLELSMIEKQTALNIRKAYFDIKTLEATLDTLKSSVEVAQRNYSSASESFAVGEATNIDVMDAHTSLIQAQRDYANLKLDRCLAIYYLQMNMGSFMREFISENKN